MNINGLVEFLHELFYKTFEVLPMLGNNANYAIIAAMTGVFLYWLRQLAKSTKES